MKNIPQLNIEQMERQYEYFPLLFIAAIVEGFRIAQIS